MPRRKPGPNLVDSVREAVAQMHWLEPTDQAQVDLAIRYAQQIEEASESGDEQLKFKMLGWLGPHLTVALKNLGGTPAERKDLGVETQVKGRLAELRAARERRNAS